MVFRPAIVKILVVLVALAAPSASALASKSKYMGAVSGKIGKFPQWGSGSIDVNQIRDFDAGECLILTLDGSARKFLFRMLSVGERHPDSRVGVIGT